MQHEEDGHPKLKPKAWGYSAFGYNISWDVCSRLEHSVAICSCGELSFNCANERCEFVFRCSSLSDLLPRGLHGAGRYPLRGRSRRVCLLFAVLGDWFSRC